MKDLNSAMQCHEYRIYITNMIYSPKESTKIEKFRRIIDFGLSDFVRHPTHCINNLNNYDFAPQNRFAAMRNLQNESRVRCATNFDNNIG